jgi:hypothetical protein
MNLPQIQRILQDFEKESSQMDMKEEMMSDSIDDAMEDEGEGEEEEGNKILDEVLAEIGISMGQQVRSAPSSSLGEGRRLEDEELTLLLLCSWEKLLRPRRLRVWRNQGSDRQYRWAKEGCRQVVEAARSTSCRRGWITCGKIS